ncbi:hypothetical protein DL96DRAFT_348135 [Flagelloscypha sp. PMI_526]|nr:hypothetical protein DL96DRAFT_348135 [Flagelloscypha sp. PMI_526]
MPGAKFTNAGAAVISLFCETFLYGTYTILFASAIYVWTRKSSSEATSLGLLIRVLTVLMFFVATTNISLTVVENYRVFAVYYDARDVTNNVLNTEGNRYIVEQLSLDIANCILADLILSWRAWALFDRNLKILIVPMFLILGSTITGGVNLWNISKWKATGGIGDDLSVGGIFSPFGAPWLYAMAICILLTNVLCTAMIAWKVFQHKRILSKANLSHLASAYQWIALTVCESGGVYLTVWIIFMLLAILGHPAIIVMVHILAQLTGIVPTLIVVLVSVKADAASMQQKLSSIGSSVVQKPGMDRLSFAQDQERRRRTPTFTTDTRREHEYELELVIPIPDQEVDGKENSPDSDQQV